jgi:heat shock protein HspQ
MIETMKERTFTTQIAAIESATPAVFTIGDVVRHRLFPFRGVIFDVDPVFNNTEEWWNAIPEGVRPRRDQPFYHLLAENDESAYVSGLEGSRYKLRPEIRN